MPTIPVACQLYTLRDQCAKDFLGTLKQVKEIGFAGVELAGNGGLTAPELKKTLETLGLKLAGAHVGIEALETDFDNSIAFYKHLGATHLIVPWMPEERRKTGEEWAKVGRELAAIGAKVKAQGMALCYHNHSFEFQKFNGQTAMDIFYNAADKENLKAELDTYWVQHGGEVPAQYMQKFPNRIPLLHCKDMAKGPEQRFAPVGEGILDWKAIFAAAPAAGVKWYIVEQDNCYDTPPIEALKISFNNLKKMGIA